MQNSPGFCNSASHFSRRGALQALGLSGISFLTPLAEKLARAAESEPRGSTPRSLIVLWMQGGPSQLETFDPHPKTDIAAGSLSIPTAVKGIEIGNGLPLVAEQMESISLVRSVVSKEGDHERATYYVKNGYRPDPTLVHPSLGAVLCHQTQDNIEIPRHISLLPNIWAARGGYLGDQFDAFKSQDPLGPVPDVKTRVAQPRFDQRLKDLALVEGQFARGRMKNLDQGRTLHQSSVEAARRMMSSEQLAAFDVSKAPEALRQEFGETPFGRCCLAALQLVEVGVRCVEIRLDSWDSHANNHEFCKQLNTTLDPAFASLIKHLRERKLFDRTMILWAGEFGRTPKMNGLGGRDHWPHGFSMALAGGGIAGGRVIGETAPQPKLDDKNRLQDVSDPRHVEDVHATILHAFGIDYKQELETPIGRPMALSQGKVIRELLA
ncbi:hypothetical protein ETAA8_67380 [Anatilimnocola aggregata]|uniref:DUF1501 domain-containing protein n=1 Tax=Anatilimnocola aggregata TaxID=2528021 RepID=A0A517YMX8_9BACT|nr:DUF1501 domain-containing protein [Anatilimnocola aggregata]QDU31578.1 hypothetical protein ETAA8_67380 [Anatilimnocola aggregata]